MPAGRFDKRVEIQAVTETRDPIGGVTESWATADTRWGELVDSGGRELFKAQQVNAEVNAVITLREQYAGLSEKNRLVIGSRTFNIRAVLGESDRETRRGQIVHCTEERA